MAVGEYSQAELNTDVTAIVSGSFTAANFLTIANQAVRQVAAEVDLHSMKRKTDLSPNLFDDVFQYSAPADLKGMKVIDVKPQIDRNRYDHWRLTDDTEFDRYKQNSRLDRFGDPIEVSKRAQWVGENLVAVSERDLVKKIYLSRAVDDKASVIDTLDSVGTWLGFGDGGTPVKDADNYVKGSASLNWDIGAGGTTTAGIVNSAVTTFNVTDYKGTGSIFVWTYITATANITNFKIRVGSSSSNYYEMTVTTDNEGNAFVVGWNLLRFDMSGKTTTGTPVDTACVYVALYMTKTAGKINENDYRFDHIVMKLGKNYQLVYYSKYGWQTSAGAYIENATATTDLLNADTDEYDLILEKTCELMERHLKNLQEAAIHKAAYEERRARYIFEHPSEALILIQTYWDI